ncbi:guanine nucleotide-binding protein subunit alpha [Hesseltinella vesiculosa]|uniref:Guanine nucleotide-binding protein subunit alpha n=1 Tax=Hesseltinella vesiculosa TaxID=101127 RepID=A0A1X2GBB7_9FUNG|nr:guanine nucleotide-binding protein subunit alpha [Hesseltinella vesiculosa]
MGCCASTQAGDGAGKLRTEEIDNQLRMDRIQMENEVKLLLLGAGESGKSTILKQMKLIHDEGFSQDERVAYIDIIYSNTLQSIRVILEAMEDLDISLGVPDNQTHVQTIMGLPSQISSDDMSSHVVIAIKTLWADPGVKEAFSRSSEYQLNDSASYYFDSIDRMTQTGYVPTDQDVLRSRVKTTGITETKFKVGELIYRMFDVGGQRSERKKWIHCFENVTAIIFMVAISEYDQVLVEDESVNRMKEALQLFDSVCNSRWFAKTSTILFLNKTDIFRQKLLTSPLSEEFPDFQGGTDEAAARDFIMKEFATLNDSPNKHLYTHFTCATDTEQVEFVMTAVHDIILQSNLRNVGLL